MKRLAAVAAVGVLLLTGCGAGSWEPEPSFEEECGGGVILEDSTSKTEWVSGGEGGTVTVNVTLRVCVDRGGSVIAIDIQ